MYGTFDAEKYVREHCSSYITGIPSSKDKDTIRNDPNLTSDQKQEALRRLEHLSLMYY